MCRGLEQWPDGWTERNPSSFQSANVNGSSKVQGYAPSVWPKNPVPDTLNNAQSSRPLPQVVFFLALKILALLSAGLLYHLPWTLSTKIAAARKHFWLPRSTSSSLGSQIIMVYNYYYSPFIIPQTAGYVQQNFQKIFFILYKNLLA